MLLLEGEWLRVVRILQRPFLMHNIGFWNIEGLNDLNKQKVVKWFMHNNGVGLFGVLETKLKPNTLLKRPTSICDDFNTVLSPIERLGGQTTEVEMEQCQECASLCCMDDISATGALYTWSNKQEASTRVYSRFDRAMGNLEWMAMFGDYIAHFHHEGLFDHCPCTVVNRRADLGGKRSFKYFNMWGKAADFKASVLNVWRRVFPGTKMFGVIKKLKALKPVLKKLNSACFSDIENTTAIASLALANIQQALVDNPGDLSLIQQELDLARDLKELTVARDSFLSQKAKVQWSIEGDLNTAYFHHAIKERIMMNKVFQIEDKDGRLCTEEADIQMAFLDYYQALLGSHTQTLSVQQHVVTGGPCCTEEHWLILAQPVTIEEVKHNIFSIPNGKSPGPDGYSSQFYKDAWDIIGDEVGAAVIKFFDAGRLLTQVNSTVITLIPKLDRPTSVKHFRPISCCNVLYKAISKIMCNRLARFLPDIISRNQGAFVKGRSILENILICQDLVRLYNRGMVSPRCMFKLDLQKAYDSIEWQFVDQMLRALNFPEHFRKLIMLCITTPSYTLNLNGSQFGFFHGKRGLRSIMLLLRALSTFSETSGLRVNASKSEVVFNGVSDEVRMDVVQVSGFQQGVLPFKYLGVPIQPGRLSKADCHILLDKVVHKIRGIGTRKLSYAGRKKEGGLDIKSVEVWNKATVGKLVNWIHTKADRLNICKVKDILNSGFVGGHWQSDARGYSIQSGYYWLQGPHPLVQWYNSVWASWNIPKHSLVGWMVKHQGLQLRDKLFQLQICDSNSCVTCEQAVETHDHLFGSCVYSSQITDGIERWLSLTLATPRRVIKEIQSIVKARILQKIQTTLPQRQKEWLLSLNIQAYDRALSIYDSVLATEAEESAKSKFLKRSYVAPNASHKKQKYEARPYTSRDQGQAREGMTYFRCRKPYHPGTSCAPGTPITCYTCKAPGHKAVDCPQKPKAEVPKVEAPKTGRVFVMSRAEADANPDVVTEDCA
ncbi:uncharacterized protein LOC141613726 [Silene latifolia]|uniref:uncharacterized protein LOC141613726 n=1 Tax=Silene latifolia TaxID=37657 RepID=UPI003D77E350